MRILIVDDCRATALHISEVLNQAGFPDSIAVHDFEQAMQALNDSRKTEIPIDLIIMDISLPGTDGIAATLTIKSQYEFEDTPVIIVTAHDDEAYLDRAFAAGASDYIIKPPSKIELRARIRSALQLKREMAKRRQREQELQTLAYKLEKMTNLDGLTGLANRRCFDDTLVKEWVRNGRQDVPMALIMIDIDHFKSYNDTLGHVDGDTCLCAVAAAIKNAVHRPGDMVARYGGEEFVVILPDTDCRGASAVAETIHANLAQSGIRHPQSSVSCAVTVSIGVASCVPACETTPENLLHAADRALYQAKQQGRNRTKSMTLRGPDSLRQ
ncbi:GGDEF domain-containing response regulator [Pseudodesulfovibrio piezophilus]|uniref:diguanylate cyclase n=1 Tax=Pseudodesulfovibrio piezophilus (strain DSM 21447 / JCM 15486 / C1TLV30) TaxID=1322246 RepID=M1WS52_PSEP2|nr:diguanylate cyclase [Pseudodesulfovibrio piezophilus]CCH49969.1 Response regulator receiver modulated diguanylate cyclase [Pseudodesulfovibrio piezophilus C1TLV30]